MSNKTIHVIVMISLPIVIFFYKTIYYYLTKNSKKTGDYKEQIKNSFMDMKMLMILNLVLISLIHLFDYVNVMNIASTTVKMIYSPVMIEGILYLILPILRDLLLSSTKNVKFDKFITYIGFFFRIGLYAKSIFSKDSKVEVKLDLENPSVKEDNVVTKRIKLSTHKKVVKNDNDITEINDVIKVEPVCENPNKNEIFENEETKDYS